MYEYENMGSGSGGVALASMTENPAYVTAGEAVTGFSSGPEEDKEMDHTYEVLPFEANEEMVLEDTAHGGGGEAADDVQVYVNWWKCNVCVCVCTIRVISLIPFRFCNICFHIY